MYSVLRTFRLSRLASSQHCILPKSWLRRERQRDRDTHTHTHTETERKLQRKLQNSLSISLKPSLLFYEFMTPKLLVKHSTFIATHSLTTTQLTFPTGGSDWALLLKIPLVPAGKLALPHTRD